MLPARVFRGGSRGSSWLLLFSHCSISFSIGFALLDPTQAEAPDDLSTRGAAVREAKVWYVHCPRRASASVWHSLWDAGPHRLSPTTRPPVRGVTVTTFMFYDIPYLIALLSISAPTACNNIKLLLAI